MGIVGIFKD